MSANNLPARDPRSPVVRASDEDREQFAQDLRTHAVAGRLDTDELEDRLQAAYRARTIGDLDALRADLPVTPQQLAIAHRQRRSQLVRRSVQETGGTLGAFVIASVVWVASGASGFFWPVIVLAIFVLSAVRSGWDLYGPGADLDAAEARLDAKADRDAIEREQHERYRERRRAGSEDDEARRRERRARHGR